MNRMRTERWDITEGGDPPPQSTHSEVAESLKVIDKTYTDPQTVRHEYETYITNG
jgi:hypothetical protein